MPISVKNIRQSENPREPKTVSVIFEPKEDITAYELAQLLPYVTNNQPMFEEHWEQLGEMQRHFVVLSQS